MIVSNTKRDILELIGRFKFMTLSMLMPITGKSISYMRGQLAGLKSMKLIDSHNLEKPIKTESMYYLTESGKELLLANSKIFADDLRLVIGVPVFVADYPHRKATIQIQVSLYYHLLSLGIMISEFLCYFDKSGNNRKAGNLEALTKISIGKGDAFFIPDCTMLTRDGEHKKLYLIEMFCDSSTSRPIDQVFRNYLPAIAAGSPGDKFGLAANPTVLLVFESPSIKSKAIEKLALSNSFKPFEHLFFFADLQTVMNNAASAWCDVNGNILSFTAN